jgi:amino acid transporter
MDAKTRGVRNGKRIVLTRKLNTFDVTNLVVGSIIGADIYIATGLSAGLVGPSALLAWVLAGVMAMVIALSFAYCVTMLPRTGGPYAYFREVTNPFGGFMVGWSLLLAEWFSLAVFPVAFAQYFTAIMPLDAMGVVLLKAGFMTFIVVSNILSVKAAGRANDVLTIIKLSPLLIIVLGGLAFMFANPAIVGSNMNPFFTGDALAFGSALVLIFWAYAGFELSTLPAEQVEKPQITIPKAIVIGMGIVIIFYLLTNLVVIGSVSEQALIASDSPLLTTAHVLFDPLIIGPLLVGIVAIGALFSIMGADESGTIGSSQLTYAMSVDGLLPHSIAKTGKGGAPYVAIIVLCSTAFVVSLFGGLAWLINASVFLLAFVYLCTCISTIWLMKKYPERATGFRGKLIIPVLGAAFSLLLLMLTDPQEILVSLALMGVGVPIYMFFSPKKEMAEARAAFNSTEQTLSRAAAQRTRFLAHPIHHLRLYIYRRRKIEPPLRTEDGKNRPG